MKKAVFSVIAILALAVSAGAQDDWKNCDEMAIAPYMIPDVLAKDDGSPVTSVRQWEKRRRDILEAYQKEMYGHMPARPAGLHFEVGNVDESALGGKATRKEVKVFLSADGSVSFTMLLYVPNERRGPVPAFLGLNFQGNHTVCDDPGISLYDTLNLVTRFGAPKARGAQSYRWPVEMIVDSGYALATVYYEEIAPDYEESGHYTDEGPGTACIWAWGLSRAMDYLVKDPDLDKGRIAVIGHSRLGKTALWAAAMDRRFAMAVSSCSGCCGAALFRRRIGEVISVVHWFSPAFFKYVGREEYLPFDQHFLIASIAPRPVYITDATDDVQADPHGEFLSCRLASPVYSLYGKKGLVTDPVLTEPLPEGYVPVSGYRMFDTYSTAKGPARDGGNAVSDAILLKGFPRADTPLQDGYIGYHMRTGVHDITSWDWEQIISFANRRLK